MVDRATEMMVFVQAAKAGSFAAAGLALGLSAQVVGKHITSLESRLGVKLLTRTTRRQSLTEAGEAYYERAKVALAEFAAAEDVANDFAATPRGRLRISAPVSFGSLRLMKVVCDYLAANPGVQVDLSLTDRVVDLVHEGFEAAVRIGNLPDSGLIAKRLAPNRLRPFASPKYLEAKGAPKVPADLISHHCLMLTYPSRPPMRDWIFERNGTVEKVRIDGRLRVDGCSALVKAAVEGLGIVLIPEFNVETELASGRLVRLLPEWEGSSREMHIIFAPDHHLTPKLRGFIDVLVEAFAP
jgi:DNA-binding transcriptional LysR family regulator